MRAARKSFLKEVQSELCLKGQFLNGRQKKVDILGVETWLEQGLESEAVLIDAAVLQSPICAKSTEVNPCKLVFYLYHHPQQHHHPPHHHYFHFTDGEAETSPKPHKNWSLVLGFESQIPPSFQQTISSRHVGASGSLASRENLPCGCGNAGSIPGQGHAFPRQPPARARVGGEGLESGYSHPTWDSAEGQSLLWISL